MNPFASVQQATSPSSSTPAVAGASVSQALSSQSTRPGARKKQSERQAREQLKQEEHRRVLGVMATFNTTNNKDALPLTAGEKYQLFFKSATDPWPFLVAGFVSGIDQAEDSFPEYGQGMEGYGKRFGASYTDYFTGNFFGNALLTSLLHEDPPFFRKAQAAPPAVLCGRQAARCGANATMAPGDQTMRTSWAIRWALPFNLYYPGVRPNLPAAQSNVDLRE